MEKGPNIWIEKQPLLYYMSFIKKKMSVCLFYEKSVKKQFYKKLGYTLNLENPTTFNEKIQWRKFYDHNPIYTRCADKYEVRQYVEEKIGKQYLIGLYGVYDDPMEIDIEKLPDKFVLKPNHSAGKVIICTDKGSIDWKKKRKLMRRWLKENYYYMRGEWQYKDIHPRIMCEKLLDADITDYKFFCYNGQPKYIHVHYNRQFAHKEQMYDINWNKLELEKGVQSEEKILECPKSLNEMIQISQKLSEDFDFVRVDLYEVDGKPYFGELTFTPGNGFSPFRPQKWDKIFGEPYILPKIEKQVLKNEEEEINI